MNQIGSKLIKEVKANRVSIVKQILRTYPYVINYKDNNYGVTALMYASLNGSTECVRLLLGAGASPNLQSNYGLTALMYASKKGHSDCVRLLLEAGAKPNLQNNSVNSGNTALILASYWGHEECVRLLLQGGANPFIQTSDGWTAYYLAETETIKKLLKNAMKAYPVMSLLGKSFKKKSGIPPDVVRKMVQEYLFSKKYNKKSKKHYLNN